MTGATAGPAVPAPPAPDLAPLGVCAVLVLLGVIVLVDASTVGNNSTGTDPLGPRAVPLVLGSALIVLAFGLLVAVLRGDRPDLEGGEDIDLDQRVDVKTVLMLVAVFIANILLID